MKKLSLIILVIAGSFAFTSCSTDQCECTVNGVSSTFDEDDVSNGSTLEEACDDSNSLNQAAGTGSCKMI